MKHGWFIGLLIGLWAVIVVVQFCWPDKPQRSSRAGHAVSAVPSRVNVSRRIDATSVPARNVRHVSTPAVALAHQPARIVTPRPAAQPVRQPSIALPAARTALYYVGADPDAEKVWLKAINDPDMPANARQDLIEDLNEEGFPDPHNVTADDLPLIVSRIEIIEQYAPNAMDKVNADAFQEAYKDLTNMYDDLVGPQ